MSGGRDDYPPSMPRVDSIIPHRWVEAVRLWTVYPLPAVSRSGDPLCFCPGWRELADALKRGDVIVQVPPLSEERLYPKEKALIDMVAAERMEGRRVLVYATHTGTRDITERMDDIFTRHGFRVAVTKAAAVASNKREKWVADRVKQGIDVMICHPRLVQTGLDLIDFPTLIWYETEFSVFQSTQKSAVLMGRRFGCDRS